MIIRIFFSSSAWQFDIWGDQSKRSSTTSLWSWFESVNTASGVHVVNDIKHDDVFDNASTISSDLSILDESTNDDTSVDVSDLSYNEDDDEDSLTTVTYMSDFTVFLDDSEDEDTLTTVTSLSNFTADLFDDDEISLSDYSSDESLADDAILTLVHTIQQHIDSLGATI